MGDHHQHDDDKDPTVTLAHLVDEETAMTIIRNATAIEVEKHKLIGGAKNNLVDHTEEDWNKYEQVARRRFDKRHKKCFLSDLTPAQLYDEIGLNPQDNLNFRTIDEHYEIRETDQKFCKKRASGRVVPVLKNGRMFRRAISAILTAVYPGRARLSEVIETLALHYHGNEKHCKLLFKVKSTEAPSSSPAATEEPSTHDLISETSDTIDRGTKVPENGLHGTGKESSNHGTDVPAVGSSSPYASAAVEASSNHGTDVPAAGSSTRKVSPLEETDRGTKVPEYATIPNASTRKPLRIQDGTGRHVDGLDTYDGGKSSIPGEQDCVPVSDPGGAVILDNRNTIVANQALLKQAEAQKVDAEARKAEVEARREERKQEAEKQKALMDLLGDSMAENKKNKEEKEKEWKRKVEDLEQENNRLREQQQQQQQQQQQPPQPPPPPPQQQQYREEDLVNALNGLTSQVKKGRKQNAQVARISRTIMNVLTPQGKAPPELDSSPSTTGESSPSTAGESSPSTTGESSPSTGEDTSEAKKPPSKEVLKSPPRNFSYESPAPRSPHPYDEADADEDDATISLERERLLTELAKLYNENNKEFAKLQKVILDGKVGTVVGVTEAYLWCVLDSVSSESVAKVLHENESKNTILEKKQAARKADVVLQKSVGSFAPLNPS